MTKLPTPRECGLPPKFTLWRPKQEEGLHLLRSSVKRVKALSMPTGSGKSPLIMADAILSGEPTVIVTESRGLQDQLMADFKSCGLVDLRGRSNYSCNLRPDDPDYSCEQGYASRCPHKGTVQCEASFAEMRAAASMFVVTNYDKWIHSRKFGMGLQHIKRAVFDEAHEMHNALSRAMQVKLGQHEVEEMMGVNFPDHHDAEFFSSWKTWAQEARVRCEELLIQARNRIAGHDPKHTWVKHYTHLRNLSRRLSILSTANINNWVVEEMPKGYQFDPIQPARYAESSLLLNVPSIVCVSATLRPKMLYMVGIGKEHFDFKEFASDFDPKRCPIYYVPTMRVDSGSYDLSPLWNRLDQIAARRRDRNGIVHSVSFARRDAAKLASAYTDSMVINKQGDPATWMVEQFKAAYPGSILVSPSVGQGYDFARKAAEWQFICKLPFPPPSKVMKARTAVDPEYPYIITMLKLVQACGRITRDKDDQGETFLPDDHMKWFWGRYSHLAPLSFKQFYQEVSVLPQPPQRLR